MSNNPRNRNPNSLHIMRPLTEPMKVSYGPLKYEKKMAVKAAIDLGYPYECVVSILECADVKKISEILRNYRKKEELKPVNAYTTKERLKSEGYVI